MLLTKSIDRALAKYVATDDEALASNLQVYGRLLKKAAELSKTYGLGMPEGWDAAALEAALKANDQTPLLRMGLLKIDAKQFETALVEMANTLIEVAPIEDEFRPLWDAIDWSNYATESLMQLASIDPMKYLEAIETVSPDEDLLDLCVLPVVGFTLRAFLDPAATEASRAMFALREDTVHATRPMKCPVCGMDPVIASVTETHLHGNVKKLWCACCGGSWAFERIRCAICGDEAVSDLHYVHDEGDEVHRLHACKGCGHAMPTVFAGEEMGFNADVEVIVMSDLLSYYEEQEAQKNEDGSAEG